MTDLIKAADALAEVCKGLSGAKTATMAGLVPKAAVDRMVWRAIDKAEAALAAYQQARIKAALEETK